MNPLPRLRGKPLGKSTRLPLERLGSGLSHVENKGKSVLWITQMPNANPSSNPNPVWIGSSHRFSISASFFSFSCLTYAETKQECESGEGIHDGPTASHGQSDATIVNAQVAVSMQDTRKKRRAVTSALAASLSFSASIFAVCASDNNRRNRTSSPSMNRLGLGLGLELGLGLG